MKKGLGGREIAWEGGGETNTQREGERGREREREREREGEENYFFFFPPARERGWRKGGRERERERDEEGTRGRERAWEVMEKDCEVVNWTWSCVKIKSKLTNLMKISRIEGYNGKYGSNPHGITEISDDLFEFDQIG